jgi:hypothetical protein
MAKGQVTGREAGPVDRRGRSDVGDAFIPDPEGGPARADDDLSESLAEKFVEAATSGEDRDEEALDAPSPEEIGGPFMVTSPVEELARHSDADQPPDATREPLPRATAGDPSAGGEGDLDPDEARPGARTRPKQ